MPVIAIVGRPNVGKSTLFNRLLGRRKAIVHDRPGVTRDRNYGSVVWEGRSLVLVDTGGFEPTPTGDLFDAIRTQALAAIEEADVLLFVLDRQAGLTPADELAANILRRTLKPVITVVNKVDVPNQENDLADFWRLGFDQLFPVSAEHGRGMAEAMDAVLAALPPPAPGEGPDVGEDGALPEEPFALDASDEEDGEATAEDEPGDEPAVAATPDEPSEIRIAILGRPNIGKSTLANRLCGQERHLVHDAPGTTMDAVDSVFEQGGRTWRIVDTAGIRRKARVEDRLEEFAVSLAIRTIERCHVTLFLLDGTQPPSAQDARLLKLVEDRGRALVLLVNRWDLAKDLEDRNARVVADEIGVHLPHVPWAPVLFTSALTGKGCQRILPTVEKVFGEFNKRIPTSVLNRWLRDAETTNPPPQRYHHPVRIHYAHQTRVRPPTFSLFTNTPEAIRTPYRRYLENSMRQAFGFEGTPIRLDLKKKRKPGEPA